MANELFDKRLEELWDLADEIEKTDFYDFGKDLKHDLDRIEADVDVHHLDFDFDAGELIFKTATESIGYAGYLNGIWIKDYSTEAQAYRFRKLFESRLIDAWYQLYLSVK